MKNMFSCKRGLFTSRQYFILSVVKIFDGIVGLVSLGYVQSDVHTAMLERYLLSAIDEYDVY